MHRQGSDIQVLARTHGFALICVTLVFALYGAGPAEAQDRGTMQKECAGVAHRFYGEPHARTEMKYNGQRTDGTHAVNGRIFLEARYADFACSYGRGGNRMVEFYADGVRRNAYLPGNKGGHQGGSGSGQVDHPMMRVKGVASNDVLNVRSGPSTEFGIVGALANGDKVRSLGCKSEADSKWCHIQMLDDMKGEGWVNARYLEPLGAAHGSSAGEAGGTRTVRVTFPSGHVGVELRDRLAPGASIRYLLNARSGQDLRVSLSGAGLSYQIFNPDRTFLLDQVPAAQGYRGQLWQSGDHVIEVINRQNEAKPFDLAISVK